jgi:hypothetical protein
MQLKSHMSACAHNPRNIAKAERRAELAARWKIVSSIRAQAAAMGGRWTDELKMQLEAMNCRVHAVGPVDPAGETRQPRADYSVGHIGVSTTSLPRTFFELHAGVKAASSFFLISHVDPQPKPTVCSAITVHRPTGVAHVTRLVIPAFKAADVDFPFSEDPAAAWGAVELFLVGGTSNDSQ